MPAQHDIDNEARLIITTWTGDAVDSEFIAAINRYQHELQNKPEYLDFNEVVNFCSVGRINLTVKGIRQVGKIASSTDRPGSNRKLAIIVNSNLAYGLTRMYMAYRSFETNSTKKVRVFKDENEALQWAKNLT